MCGLLNLDQCAENILCELHIQLNTGSDGHVSSQFLEMVYYFRWIDGSIEIDRIVNRIVYNGTHFRQSKDEICLSSIPIQCS